jgi:hypothetical protein
LHRDHLPSVRAPLADHGHANLFGIGDLYRTHQHGGIAENTHAGIARNRAREAPWLPPWGMTSCLASSLPFELPPMKSSAIMRASIAVSPLPSAASQSRSS